MKFVRLAVLVGVCLVPACTKPAAPVATPTSAAKPSAGTATTNPTPVATLAASSGVGNQFFKAMKEGKATATSLTPEFKALVAAGSGAPDWAAQHWLDEFKGDSADTSVPTWMSLDAGSVLGVSQKLAGDGPQVFTYCVLVSPENTKGYLAAWLHVSPVRPAVDLSTDTAARFAGVAFVDTVLTKQTRLAESLIAPAAAKKLAPPLDDEDAKLGYNRGILTIKLNGFREAFTSVTFAPPVKAGANLTISGELTGPGTERRKFVVTVAPVGSGWLVEDFRHD